MTKKNNKALTRQEGGSHYTDFVIQPVEFCEKNKLTALQSFIIKYVCRHGKKDGAEGGKRDLKKARHCIDIMLDMYYNDDETKNLK